MTLIMWVFGLLIMTGGISLGVVRYRRADGAPLGWRKWLIPVALTLIGLMVILSAKSLIVVVGNTEKTVLENTLTGQIVVLDKGTHIFPLDPRVVPMITVPHTFETRKESRELGQPTSDCLSSPSAADRAACFRATAIAADSISPGRPPVYFWVKYQVAPIDMDVELKELWRKYGLNYKESWVEQQLTSAIKSVQGSRAYDFVGINRAKFQDLVEEALNARLIGPSGNQLVLVTQLVVENYEFTPETNQYLDTVQQQEFARQKEQQQVEINKQKQLAEQISADTRYAVEQRDAEKDRDAQRTRAQGSADARRISADAGKYEREQLAIAEAEAIRVQIEQLGGDPASYLKLEELDAWNGQLPDILFAGGDSVPILPFLDLIPGAPK